MAGEGLEQGTVQDCDSDDSDHTASRLWGGLVSFGRSVEIQMTTQSILPQNIRL